MPPHYQQSLQPVEVVDYLEEEEEENYSEIEWKQCNIFVQNGAKRWCYSDERRAGESP